MSRPLQILLGPHPIPLVINEVREFCMMALFGPAVFVAMMSLCFGSDRIPRKLVLGIFSLGMLLGLVFVVLNAHAMGKAEVIFRIGSYPAYDGLWFKNPDAHGKALMAILFVIRLIDPVGLLMLAGVIVFRHARHYPAAKRSVYDNMPKKLYLLSAAVFAYFVLRNQPEAFKLAALTFTAGLLTVAAIEDMVSEAHESGDDTHISPLAFIGGFVLFVLVSAGLEGVVSQS